GSLSLIPVPNIGAISLFSPAGNQTIQNQQDLINAATLLPGSLDPMIAGGIDMGLGMKPYLTRVTSLTSLKKIVCAKTLPVTGAMKSLFFSGSQLYGLYDGGSSLKSSLNIIGINPNNCESVPPQIQVRGPGDITCSDVTPTSKGFALACNLNQNQALTLLTDKNFTFNNLPSGFHVSAISSSRRLLQEKPFVDLNLSVTSLLNTPLRGTYFSPLESKGSFSQALEPFTQLLPEDKARYVPLPSRAPVIAPTVRPTTTRVPSFTPSLAPTLIPTGTPSKAPSLSPTISSYPTSRPSSSEPTLTYRPTPLPSLIPSASPSASPTMAPSLSPSFVPTKAPTAFVSLIPTLLPSLLPSPIPSLAPSQRPSRLPSPAPTQLKKTTKPTSLRTASPIPSQPPTNSSSSENENTEEPFFDSTTFINAGVPILGIFAGTFVAVKYVFNKKEQDRTKLSQAAQKRIERKIVPIDEEKEEYDSIDASLDLSPPASSRSSSVSDLLELLDDEEGGKEKNSLEDSWHISPDHSEHSTPLPSGFSDLENDSSHHDSKEN
ncbi:MAG: hypothetical protein K2W99_07755, partial [Chthoniobacterales bacterium]|nr:hypothetical protein [Chthoniobacterales bacterium]